MWIRKNCSTQQTAFCIQGTVLFVHGKIQQAKYEGMIHRHRDKKHSPKLCHNLPESVSKFGGKQEEQCCQSKLCESVCCRVVAQQPTGSCQNFSAPNMLSFIQYLIYLTVPDVM